MQKGIIGKKIGMTQIFDETGKVIPVTVVEAGPCVVSQKKTVENDGYAAVQIGFGDLKAHKVNKPMKGHFAKADVAPKKYSERVQTGRYSTLTTLATSSKRTYLPPATKSTLPAQAKVKAMPA